MVACQDCELEMLIAPSCTVDTLLVGGEPVARMQVGTPIGPDGRCGDCGIRSGGFHHLGCDLEPCPRCGWQLITCGCGADADGERMVEPVLPETVPPAAG